MLMKAVWNMYGEERDCSARIIYLNVQCSEPPNIFEAQLHTYTVGPLLLRRLGHGKTDAINEVDAIFEGRTKTFLHF